MHETAVSEAIFDTVSRNAQGRKVERVDVRIGHFRQVVPDALVFAWDMQVMGTELEGAVLVVDHVPGVIECTTCGASTTLEDPILLCGSCESADVKLVSGKEFTITSIDRTREVT